MTLGWWNWPIVAASCKNLTLSTSFALSCSIFTATSFKPESECQMPLCTCPNRPDPRWPIVLCRQYSLTHSVNKNRTKYFCSKSILNLLSRNFSESFLSQLLIDVVTVHPRIPKGSTFNEELLLLQFQVGVLKDQTDLNFDVDCTLTVCWLVN